MKASRQDTYTRQLTPGTDLLGQLVTKQEGLAGLAKEVQSSLTQQTGVPNKPQGFKTRPERAVYDDGDWPFAPIYGLRYPVVTKIQATRSGG